MKNFHSPSLNRTFESIYFVGFITKAGEKPPGSMAPPQSTAGAAPDLKEPITQPKGGTSVANLYAQRKKLDGKEVVIKGQVTKVTLEILDRNWIHIADGTGMPGERDVTVTTTDTASVGDIVTVRGKVAIDQNFGHGYAYPVIIEKATLGK